MLQICCDTCKHMLEAIKSSLLQIKSVTDVVGKD